MKADDKMRVYWLQYTLHFPDQYTGHNVDEKIVR